MKKQLSGHFRATTLTTQSQMLFCPHRPEKYARLLAEDGWKRKAARALDSAVLLLLLLLSVAPLLVIPLHAAPSERRQSEANGAFFALLPIENSAGELQTHTADIIVARRDGQLIAEVDALYRLQNSEREAITVLTRLVAQDESAAADPDAVEVTLNGQPAALLPAENGALTAQIPLDGDGRGDVRLRYAVQLEPPPLVDLRYDARDISAWPGARSLRVTYALPVDTPPASWLAVAPDGWRDVIGSENAIKWLYDGLLPDQAMRLLFIHPSTWAQLQAAETTARAGGDARAYGALGDLYRALADAAGRDEAATRFFAQALAAYSTGLDAAGEDRVLAASLQRGVAALYRSRISGIDSRRDGLNAALMTEAAIAAAAGLPPQSREWTEMVRWQQEGLNLQLIAARAQQDWARGLGLVERLASLPESFVDDGHLAQQRRELEVQQALQLLGQGDRSAAMALAGEAILDAQLAPPVTAQSLFASWQATITTSIDGTEILLTALPADGMDVAARSAFEEQLARWQGVDLPRGVRVQSAAASQPGGEPATDSLRLSIMLPAGDATGDAGDVLASLVSGGPQWALLRALLQQSASEVEQRGRLLWQETTLRQALGLATVGDQWRAMAANLTREAAQFEAQAAALVPDPAAAEEALQAEIRAVNYRNAAAAWERLADSSWVVTTLKAPSTLDSLARSWMTTVNDPAQSFEYSTQSVRQSRVLLAALIGVVALLLGTTLLWRLL